MASEEHPAMRGYAHYAPSTAHIPGPNVANMET